MSGYETPPGVPELVASLRQADAPGVLRGALEGELISTLGAEIAKSVSELLVDQSGYDDVAALAEVTPMVLSREARRAARPAHEGHEGALRGCAGADARGLSAAPAVQSPNEHDATRA